MDEKEMLASLENQEARFKQKISTLEKSSYPNKDVLVRQAKTDLAAVQTEIKKYAKAR